MCILLLLLLYPDTSLHCKTMDTGLMHYMASDVTSTHCTNLRTE